MSVKDSPIQANARAYADSLVLGYPGNHAAWGIAFDAFIEGSQSVSNEDAYVTKEMMKVVNNYNYRGYTDRGISKQTTWSLRLVRRIQKQIKFEEQKLMDKMA